MTTNNTIQSALSSIAKELKNLRSQLNDANLHINKLTTQMTALKELPLSLEDWGEYLKVGIAATGEKHAQTIGRELLHDSIGQDAANKQPWRLFEQSTIIKHYTVNRLDLFQSTHDLDEMMCFYFPELVYEKVMKQLKVSHAESWGNTELPSLAERREMLKQLETDLSNSELKRDALNRQINEISAFAN